MKKDKTFYWRKFILTMFLMWISYSLHQEGLPQTAFVVALFAVVLYIFTLVKYEPTV